MTTEKEEEEKRLEEKMKELENDSGKPRDNMSRNISIYSWKKWFLVKLRRTHLRMNQNIPQNGFDKTIDHNNSNIPKNFKEYIGARFI